MSPMQDPEAAQNAERQRIIRGRNRALALVLAGMALLFFFITIAKLS